MKFNIDSMDLHVDKKNANVFKRSSNSNLMYVILYYYLISIKSALSLFYECLS